MASIAVGPKGALIVVCAAVVLGCSEGATGETLKSLRDLPEGQYAIEGLAGVRIVSTPLDVTCSEEPSMVVGVRFTRSARRVRYVRMQRVSANGKVLEAGPKFSNSPRWQFARLRLPGCRKVHDVQHVFYRQGDRSGQKLGNTVCVLGPKGEHCADTFEAS